MGFLGPGRPARTASSCARTTSRVLPSRATARVEAMVRRVVHLGFEVRVELALADGALLAVQLTRDEADALELARGDIVWVGHGDVPVAA